MTMASTLTGFTLTRLQKSSVYDVVMRLPVLAWSLVLALALAVELARYWHAADPALPGAIVLNIAMRLSMIGYLVILAATVVVRTPPIGKARGDPSRARRRFYRGSCAHPTARFVQHYGRGATASHLRRLPLCTPPALPCRGNRDNRRCHTIFLNLDGAAPRCADRVPNSADEE